MEQNPFADTDMRSAIWEHVQALRRNQQRFESLFHVPLRRFWINNIVGLHLTKFDDEVIQSGDRQMREVVLEKFGEAGVSCILDLIGEV